MKSVLERLKLVEYLTTELHIDKKIFVEKLKMYVDEGDTGIFLSSFEAFSSSKNEYKGIVTFDSFKIRRRRRLFDMSMNLAVVEGRFRQREHVLIIESTIKGFRGIFIPFVALILMFYIVSIISVFLSDIPSSMGWSFIPLIFIHASIMLGIPYFMMKRAVSRMKYELDRDFFYLTK